MHIDLSGKVAVVTGAGRGIGRTIALRLANERAKVVLWDRDSDSADVVASEINRAGGAALAVECDVANERAVETAVEVTKRECERIDVLVNNAGIAPSGTVDSLKLEDWDNTFAVNVRGVMLASRAVIPTMKSQHWGRILNASSFAAILPSYAFAAYASSKAAVVSFTRVLAAELGPWGVTVNSYAPGMVPTQMNRLAEASPERQKQLLDTLTLRRWGQPDDVASLLIFLASDHASYITGALIDVSGGKFSVQFPQAAYASADL